MNIKKIRVFGNNVSVNGNNVTIVNGRVVGGGGTGKTQKFNERKAEKAENVEKITINSTFVNVKVSAAEVSEVEAHFYGQADVDGKLNFDVRLSGKELRITLDMTGSCYNSDLMLDVSVPYQMFNKLSVKTMSAAVTVLEGVSSKTLNIKTTSGDIYISSDFTNASLGSTSGDVDVNIKAKTDISLDICTTSGDASTYLNNIGKVKLSTSTVSGNVRNMYIASKGYTAELDISTTSGDIRIR